MKKVTNRCLALFLIATMAFTSLPQSVLTATAAEITEDAENTESTSETADSDLDENLSDIPSDEIDIVEGEPAEDEGTLEDTDTEDTEQEAPGSDDIEDASMVDNIKDASMVEDISAQPEMAVNVPAADRTKEKASGTGYSGNIEWFLDTDGILEVTGNGELMPPKNSDNDIPENIPWYNYRSDIKAARFINVSGVTIASGLFYECVNLEKVDLRGFDTKNVTDMSWMFYMCSALTELDLSSFDTQNVKTMLKMFWNSSALTTLDLSSFRTQNVTSMYYMFNGCKKLTTLNISSFNTENLLRPDKMFANCQSLTTLDLSSFNMSSVGLNHRDVPNMLDSCNALEEIKTPRYLPYDNVKLPSNGNAKWRCLPDGDEISDLPCNETESKTITTRKAALEFSGDVDKVTLKDSEGKSIDNMRALVDRGSKEAFTFIIEPKTGYLLESVKPKSSNPSIKIEKGTEAYRYIISPADTENGYVCDEEIEITVTQDSLERYSLSDVLIKLTSDISNGSVLYTGKAIEPKVRSVLVMLPGSKNKTVLTENTDYTVSYLNNINVGTASIVITAKEDSKLYKGSIYEYFEITQAASPKLNDIAVQVDADDAGKTQQLDLSELITLNTKYESGVKPIEYELDTSDDRFSLGDILKSNPTLQGSIMTYTTRGDAGKDSQPAVIVVRTCFENYKDARVVIRINLVKKEDLVLAGTIKADDKIYDGTPVAISADGIYVESVSGQSPNNPETILNSIKGSLDYRYTGIEGTVYDSKTAPVDVGSYKVSVAVSEEHKDYRSEYVDVGTFTISKRNIEIAADNLALCIGDTKQEYYSYTIMEDGLAKGDNITQPELRCETLDMSQIGEYPITIDVTGVRVYNSDGIDVTNNYNISGRDGVVSIAEPKEGSYTVIYDLSGHGENIVRSGIEPGSLLTKPMNPVAEGYTFLGWYNDATLSTLWNFDTDTIQGDMTIYSGWSMAASEDKGMTLCVQEIAGQRYTGAAIKPAVVVYSGDGKTLLKLGKDYALSYKNNIEADTSDKKFGTNEVPRGGIGVSVNKKIDTSEGFNEKLAYVTITGKGNYTGTVGMNFHINAVPIATGVTSGENMPASGFTLKYTDQFEAKPGKNAKIVSSLKYKKALIFGSDYTLEALKDSQPVNLTPKGELPLNEGAYILTITGKGNYTGSIRKNLYVASKDKMMKNAKITYDKTVKDVTKEQLVAGITQTNVQVSLGSLGSLTSDDYAIKYYNNHSIGTATMIVTGKGNYVGSKSVTFKIQGTAFKEREFRPITLSDFEYSGAAHMQNENDLSLIPQNGGEALSCGTDYTVDYKNNTKKGKATMIFTAKPSSGYSGSFKKTFKINPLSLDSDSIVKGGTTDNNSKLTLENSVPYRKGGAKPSNKLSLYIKDTQVPLLEGRDYTVRYTGNAGVSTGTATMNIKGKGNFSGNITVYFDIENASLKLLYNEGEINITAASMRIAKIMRYVREEDEGWWEDTQDPDKEYKPAITVNDGKKKLKLNTDYTVSYVNNTHADVAGEDGESAAPYAEIRGIGSYEGGTGVRAETDDAIIIPLSIYQESISASKIYIVYNDGIDYAYTYTGEQVAPAVAVYYGKPADISKAKREKETNEDVLTEPKPDPADYERDEPIPYAYGLVRLSQWEGGKGGGDFILTYGTNIAPGNNGIINIKGIGAYSGSASIKFNIGKKPIYKQGSSKGE